MARPTKEKQEGPPSRRNWAQSVGRDVGSAGAVAFARAGFADPSLILRWPEIVGQDVARIARPLRFSEKDGTLTLWVEAGAALFLGYETRALANRINAYLGRPAVARVKFVEGRLSAPPAPPELTRPAKSLDSGDPANGYHGPDGLKAALQSLARWRTSTTSQGD